jgi:hypothetical protein
MIDFSGESKALFCPDAPPLIVVDSGAVYRRVLWTGTRNRAMIEKYCGLGTSMGRTSPPSCPRNSLFPRSGNLKFRDLMTRAVFISKP